MGGAVVLIVGSGGREHALAWKLEQSPQVGRICVAPGNAGMPARWERWAFGASPEGYARLADKAVSSGVELVVVGPDNPLAEGIVDILESRGLRAFGPRKNAARIEASKSFAKEVMKSASVPTARHWVARSVEGASRILRSVPWTSGWVIKADGLALGKGVRVCARLEEALDAASELIRISPELVIEERLAGEELSWMAFCDGVRCALLEPARDYKRVGDGNQGPNTGGMGAFSPVAGVPRGFAERVRREVFLPALSELASRGAPFRGVLYAGLMADFARDRYWTLEFNARFGDPETQALLPRLKGDLYPWLDACARGDLRGLPDTVPFSAEAAVCVVGAAKGYPESPERGHAIRGLQPCPEGVFCAGVAQGEEGGLVTAGGRVFSALGMGESLAAARARAYERLSGVSFEGMRFRRDIAEGGA